MGKRTQPLNRVRAALLASNCRREGNDWQCPSHDDRRASLSVKAGDKQPVILKCGAGCPTAKVLADLGLTWVDLGVDADKVIAEESYEYPDEEGTVLYRVVRLTRADGSKTFRQHQFANGRWQKSFGDARHVLWNLPDLRRAIRSGSVIHLTEGEKDAEALNSYFEANDLLEFATCHPGAAGKWNTRASRAKGYLKSLKGATQVVVWGDRDVAGYVCALERLASVESKFPAEIRLPIPAFPGADVFDHLAAGHDPDDGIRAARAEVEELIADCAAPEHDAKVLEALEKIRTNHAANRLFKAEQAAKTAVSLDRVTLAEALSVPRPVEPPQRVERLHSIGYNTTITAKFKTGKTTLIGNLVRALVDGPMFLNEFVVQRPAGRVGLLNYELTDADMLDWLEAQGIKNTERVALLNLRGVPFSLASEVNQKTLADWCVDMAVEVLILDPHRRAFTGFGSENSNDDVNRFTEVLDEVKKASGVKDLFLSVHTGRMGSEMGEEHARGATALDDWADQRWVLTKGDNGERFLYASGRLPDVPEFRLAYDINTRQLEAEQGSRRTAAGEKWRAPILNALETVEEVNTGDLEKRLCVSGNGKLKRSLDMLLEEGLILCRPEGKAKFYRLAGAKAEV